MIDRLAPAYDDDMTDAEVSRLFRARIAARLANLAPAGDVAAPAPPTPPTTRAPAPAGALSCTGADRTADASGGRVAGFVPRAALHAPVSQHAAPSGGAGTYDDGTCWGEPAPERRRLHPLSVLGALLALAWVALMVAAAGAAIGLLTQ